MCLSGLFDGELMLVSASLLSRWSGCLEKMLIGPWIGGKGVAVSLCGPRAGKRAACLSICAHVHLIALFCRNYLWHPWVQISSVLYPHQRKKEKKSLLVFCWNGAGYFPGYVSPCLLQWWLRSQLSVSTYLHAF